MRDVEVLVACMYQKDDSLFKEMNLSTDVILSNQGDEFFYKQYIEQDGSIVKLVSTIDRGVGNNRNKALIYASKPYLLCSDQDMIYVDNYEFLVVDAFKKCKKADIIIFDLEYLNYLMPVKKNKGKCKRVRIWNCMRYGAASVALKRSSIDKSCISFSRLYGGGAPFSSGEDSLFIRDAFRKKMKIYFYPTVIAKVKQEKSSWFKGYNDKFFIDKGIFIANAFPKMKRLLIYYFAYGLRKVSKKYNFFEIVKLMKKGLKKYKEI